MSSGPTDYSKWARLARDGGDLDQEEHWIDGHGQGEALDSFTLVPQLNGGALSISHQSPGSLQRKILEEILFERHRCWQPFGDTPPTDAAIVDLAYRKLAYNAAPMKLAHLCTALRDCRVKIGEDGQFKNNEQFGAFLVSKGMERTIEGTIAHGSYPPCESLGTFDKPPNVDEIEQVQFAVKRLARDRCDGQQGRVDHLTTALTKLHPDMRNLLKRYARADALPDPLSDPDADADARADARANDLAAAHAGTRKLLEDTGFTLEFTPNLFSATRKRKLCD